MSGPLSVRRLAALLVAVPLSVLASLGAHELGYVAAVGSAESRGRLLAETGHGYLAHLPTTLLILLSLVALGLAVEVCRRPRPGGANGSSAWPVAVLAPLGFVFQEHLERALHTGDFPWLTVIEPAFAIGLLLQLPASLVAWWVACRLLRAARAIASVRIASRRRFSRHEVALLRCGTLCLLARAPRGSSLLSGAAGRAPPPRALLSSL